MSDNLIGATTAIFIVSLSIAVAEPVDVAWSTRDGTAKAGTDYQAANGVVSFLPGETQKQIEVTVYGQNVSPTGDKNFFINLMPPTNAVLGTTLIEAVIKVEDESGVPVTSVIVAQGKRGLKGDPGLSAYEQAVLMGYDGTLEAWMQEQADAAAAAQRASDYAANAAAAATKAENAATAASFLGNIFPTPEAGVDPVTGVGNGAYYNVRSPDDDSYLVEYQNVGGVPTPSGKSYPSSSALNNIEHNNLKGRDTAGAHPASAILDASGLSQQEINNSLILTVLNKSDLINIVNPKNNQTVYVAENKKNYVYNSSLLTAENGVTIIGKWEMELQDFYYATWFADSTSLESQTLNLQAGYDYATSKKRAFIVDAEFWIDPRAQVASESEYNSGLIIRSNSCISFVQGIGKLKAIPSDKQLYNLMIACDDVENYIILDPHLIGDRLTHTYLAGYTNEWGYGLSIFESKNGYIRRPKITQMIGDGIYIGKSWGSTNDRVPTNITIEYPEIDHIRRNGIAMCAWDNVRIIDPVISYIGTTDGIDGAAPQAGIDIEPEISPTTPSTRCTRGSISNLRVRNSNSGVSVYINIDNLHVDLEFTGVTDIDNVDQLPAVISCGANGATGHVKFEHLHFSKNMPAPKHLAHKWSASGELMLIIDQVTYDFWYHKPLIVQHYGFGSFAANKLGNTQINNIDARGNVILSTPPGVDLSTATLEYFSITKKIGSIGEIIIDESALPKLPVRKKTTKIDGVLTIINSMALANYRGGDRIRVVGTGGVPITIDAANAPNRVRVHYDNVADGYTLTISNIAYRRKGVPYSSMSTTTRGAWVDFEVISPQVTIVHDISDDWDFT